MQSSTTDRARYAYISDRVSSNANVFYLSNMASSDHRNPTRPVEPPIRGSETGGDDPSDSEMPSDMKCTTCKAKAERAERASEQDRKRKRMWEEKRTEWERAIRDDYTIRSAKQFLKMESQKSEVLYECKKRAEFDEEMYKDFDRWWPTQYAVTATESRRSSHK